MRHLVSTISLNLPLWLAQAPGTPGQQFVNLGDVWNLLKAIGIFILGLIIAWIAKAIVKGVLKRTSIDNRIASWISGREGESIPIENWIANLVFWLIVLFAIVAFLNALQLEAVSAPLNTLLNQITSFLPQILGAALLLGIAWLVATVVKLVVTRVLRAINIDERLGQQTEGPSDFALSDTIGNALYWFIFLLFLPAILSTLQLQGTLGPVQRLLNDILAILPNILAAILIGAVGWFIAQIVRRLTTNFLSATGIDRVGAKFGFSGTAGRQSLSWLIGTIVYVLVLIPVAIAALNALQIQAISAPAINMLNQVLNLLPRLFAAAVVLAIAYIIGRYIAEFVTDLLAGIGFNNLFQWLGISAPSPTPTPPQPTDIPPSGTEQPTILQTEPVIGTKTPSQIVGIIAWIAIVLIAFLTAVDILQIEALTAVVSVILAIAGQVLIGLIIFAVGLYLANVAYKLIASSNSYQARVLAQAARVAIIALASAMALNQMGVAPNLVNLAFGLLLGAVAVAIALAFGLGGREVANEQLRSWVNSFKNR
ncbi:mechanosensitive ion channel [Pleurocapsales cyanobacterium LEGE 06147]|nr:mechanosensitive ion channel [Pleurocapsales cyanobacterium LEGE 06147]